jgi:predicted anti-sigma-YlaC factor YlaD
MMPSPSSMIPAPNGCLSELLLDQLVAGELDPATVVSVRDHLTSCTSCRTLHEEIVLGQVAFAELPIPEILRRTRPARRRKLAAVAAAVLAAAILVIVVTTQRQDGRNGPVHMGEETRLKGGPRLGFFVKHGTAIRSGGPGETIEPGDGLQFTV